MIVILVLLRGWHYFRHSIGYWYLICLIKRMAGWRSEESRLFHEQKIPRSNRGPATTHH